MSKSLSDTLISVSYDCTLNIFDLRRKSVSSKIKYISPLTTVTLSDCGTYFCVGTLNGELLTGDMRNTKSFMHTKKVHNARVQRVAFVPIVASSVEPEPEPADTVRPDSGDFCLPVVVNPVQKSTRFERVIMKWKLCVVQQECLLNWNGNYKKKTVKMGKFILVLIPCKN